MMFVLPSELKVGTCPVHGPYAHRSTMFEGCPVCAMERQAQSRAATPTELRPPPEHEGKPLHWIQVGDGQGAVLEVWRWGACAFGWRNGDGEEWSPVDAAKYADHYLGPAEYHPPLYMERSLKARIAELEAQLEGARSVLDAYATQIKDLTTGRGDEEPAPSEPASAPPIPANALKHSV